MKIEYDYGLVERAVMLAVYGKPRLEASLHRDLEPAYGMPPSHNREDGFRAVFGAWFEKLKFGELLEKLLAERPAIADQVDHCLVREAAGSKSENAELFAREEGGRGRAGLRALVIQATPQSLVSPERWIPLMRRELYHISDMLDPRFAYSRSEIEGLPAKQNLVRDRYRVLWDMYVERRLQTEGLGDPQMAARLKRMFERAFGARAENALRLFESRLNAAGGLSHSELLACASGTGLGEDGIGGTLAADLPEPGGICPLCAFPTYDWHPIGRTKADSAITEYMQRSRPEWTPERGICRQCAEMLLASVETGKHLVGGGAA